MKFTTEEIETIERLSGLGYKPDKIAVILGKQSKVEIQAFIKEAETEYTILSYHILKGQLENQYKLDEKLLSDAQTGNLTARQILDKQTKEREIQRLKEKISYFDEKGLIVGNDIRGIDIDAIELDDVYSFMSLEKQTDGSLVMDPKIQRYLFLLDITRSMQKRMNGYGNKQSIINHLVSVEGLSKYKANQIYQESIEYYYSDSIVSKKSWRNKIAEGLLEEIYFSKVAKESVQDAERITKMYERLYKVLNLDQEEPPELPPMDKPFRIISFDKDDFDNLPDFNEKKLAQFIDSVDVTEPEKLKLQKEAGLMPRSIPFLDKEDA